MPKITSQIIEPGKQKWRIIGKASVAKVSAGSVLYLVVQSFAQ
ncbi:hypothetical protein [Bacillus sp. SD075]|nr:hypothetical protein [Bacillus sp. SD075]